MIIVTRFIRAEFSLFHLEVWRREQRIPRVLRIRYTRTEAVVTHFAP
jgi:hypothetical protein